jgi:thiamine biosynthesis lipoprotein
VTAALALLLAASPAVAVIGETRPALGSVATVIIAGDDRTRAALGVEAAFAAFERVSWSMNEWLPGSPLAELNARAGRGWVPIPGDLCQVLEMALDGARRTGGRFDPTWAALSDLWRFDGTRDRPPSDAEVEARCPLVDHRGLAVRRGAPGSCQARLARVGMRVGLGGLAKGWALDLAARVLHGLELHDFLLQAGGDLYAAGTRAGAPWPVPVRDPRGGPGDSLGVVPVSDRALSTSGDYEHAYRWEGRRYHHLIDPRTCRPALASRSVTVLARSAVEAEIQDKSLFVEGGEAALALARDAGVEALLVDADGRVLRTPGLALIPTPASGEAPRGHVPAPRSAAPAGTRPAAARPRRATPPPGRRRRPPSARPRPA